MHGLSVIRVTAHRESNAPACVGSANRPEGTCDCGNDGALDDISVWHTRNGGP
jgi:hypothetical protein